MESNHSNTEINEIIARYLAGESSGKEIRALEEWVLMSDENRKIFREMRSAWSISSIGKVNNAIDLDDEWKKLKSRLNMDERGNKSVSLPGRKVYYSPVWKIAAAVIVLLTVSFVLFSVLRTPRTVNLMADDFTLEQVLPDGSQITLNHHSSVEFPKNFKGDVRNVVLSGDAFFNVARNEKKPFIIHTQNSIVKVLGTAFYVNSHDNEDEISVMVSEGKVSFAVDGFDPVILTAGEKGVFDKVTRKLVEDQNTDQNFISWKTKQISFDGQDLSYVISVLQNTYHQSIELESDEIKDCKLTATFNNMSLQAILHILQETFDIEIIQQEDKMIIKGISCE